MMSYQPTMDTVVAKLEQKGALFALDEVKVLTDEIERMEGELQAARRRAEAVEEDWQAAETELAKFHPCDEGQCLIDTSTHEYAEADEHPFKVYHKDGE
jgi:hypothetical protein